MGSQARLFFRGNSRKGACRSARTRVVFANPRALIVTLRSRMTQFVIGVADSMARTRKFTNAAVRKIFKSDETAKALGARHGVSQNMIYLIRSRRAHQEITNGLAAPLRTRGRGRRRATDVEIDIKALANALADRLIARLGKR